MRKLGEDDVRELVGDIAEWIIQKTDGEQLPVTFIDGRAMARFDPRKAVSKFRPEKFWDHLNVVENYLDEEGHYDFYIAERWDRAHASLTLGTQIVAPAAVLDLQEPEVRLKAAHETLVKAGEIE